MIALERIPQNTVIMSCPPYACVPYEPRKRFVCAYCFKGFKHLEEQWNAQVQNVSEMMENMHISNNQDNQQNDETCQQTNENDNEIPETPFEEINYDPNTHNTETETPETNTTETLGEEKQNNENLQENEETFQFEPITNQNQETKEDDITELIPCPYCNNLWYCSQECLELDSHEHLMYECISLQNFDINWAKEYYQYCDDLITDVRLLIKVMNRRMIQLENQSNEFYDEYDLLISNRSCYSEEILETLRGVVQYANYLVPENVFMDEEELLDVYCKHRVNMFGLWNEHGDCLGYGVYPRASYFNHSCWPNTTFYKNPDSKLPYMDFMTVWDIEEPGEEVCISYIDISVGLMPRRQTLLEKYFFHCTCQRCVYQEENPHEEDPYNIYWVQKPSEQSTETQEESQVDSQETQENKNEERTEDNEEKTEDNEEEKTKDNESTTNEITNNGSVNLNE